MWLTSVFTAPFGLTEPLFVPEYWNPPSLFDLAQRTGFDVESLIFAFGIGGIGAVLYSILAGERLGPMEPAELAQPLHRHHLIALMAPVGAFLPLYLLPWNPIYPAIVAMTGGAFAAITCRPDLKRKTLIGGALFCAYYLIFMLGLKWLFPGYIERVWNLASLSGIMLWGIPLEELLFGLSFGMYWSSVYEHVTWRKAMWNGETS